MAYLDVSPMIVALRTSPTEFDLRRGLLRHKPSGHWVLFDPLGGSARSKQTATAPPSASHTSRAAS